MDDFINTNRERWNALARANVEYSQPYLNFTREQATKYICRHDVLKNVEGKNVLCLASGGGQDSVAFGLLGARVTVLDLSDVQLERDQQAAAHHDLEIKLVQGDMRNLTAFPDIDFDIVWQVYSINFVPTVEPVFREVHRVLKPNGIYFLQFANPFAIGIDEDKWDGNAYALNCPYREGEDLSIKFPDWDVVLPDRPTTKCASPHEYRHTLGMVFNSMVSNGFNLLGLWEWIITDERAQPGSWEHYTQVIPPYLSTFWRRE